MGMRYGGNMEVTVKKTELLDRLKENRDKHSEDYENAMKRWRQDLVDALREVKVTTETTKFPKKLSEIKSNLPTEHLLEYDRVIDMFSMSTADEIVITNDMFNQYCRDEWSWKSSFLSNSYVG